MDERPLTMKEDRFCLEYTLDYIKTKAAIRAGYSEKNAAKMGCKLMKDPRILKRIREIQKEMAERLMLTQERVILELMDVVAICKAEKPVMKWDYINHEMVPTGEYQIDARGAVKALELAGKHLGMFERKEQPEEHSGPVFYSGEEDIKE